MADMDDMFSLKTALSWFDLVEASLDCHSWVFSQGLLTPSQILTGEAAFWIRSRSLEKSFEVGNPDSSSLIILVTIVVSMLRITTRLKIF